MSEIIKHSTGWLVLEEFALLPNNMSKMFFSMLLHVDPFLSSIFPNVPRLFNKQIKKFNK